MSCFTDSRFAGRRGSILMEFVMVLPLYLLLLGVAVLLGDFALRSIWLTHGDVLVAHAIGDDYPMAFAYLAEKIKAYTYTYADGKNLPIDIVSSNEKIVLADPKFKGGAWTCQIAGTAMDWYALPPWARGWLGYSEWTYRTQSGGGKNPEGPVFSNLLIDGVGRYRIVSSDLAGAGGLRQYGYYTLMRTKDARDGNKTCRNWPAKDLSDNEGWCSMVYEEPFPTARAKELEDGEKASVEFPKRPSGRKDYSRGKVPGLLSQ